MGRLGDFFQPSTISQISAWNRSLFQSLDDMQLVRVFRRYEIFSVEMNFTHPGTGGWSKIFSFNSLNPFFEHSWIFGKAEVCDITAAFPSFLKSLLSNGAKCPH